MEEHFAINVLVPYQLFKRIKLNNFGAKIVFIGSSAMDALSEKPSILDYSRPDHDNRSRFKPYSMSKYFQYLLMRYIQSSHHRSISTFSIHPGMVKSSLSKRDFIGDFIVRQIGHRYLSTLFLSPSLVGEEIVNVILQTKTSKEKMISLSGIPCGSQFGAVATAAPHSSADIDELVLFLNKFN